MKISIISNLLCAMALIVSVPSFAGDRNNDKSKEETVATANFEAALYKIIDSNRVRLLVDVGVDETLRVTLKDKSGRVYYSDKFDLQNADNNRIVSLIFDLDDLRDGTYYFELYQKGTSVVKTVDIASNNSRLISLK